MSIMENLRALVYGHKLNAYQQGLAVQEFEQLTSGKYAIVTLDGNLDGCEISEEDRKLGIDISELTN